MKAVRHREKQTGAVMRLAAFCCEWRPAYHHGDQRAGDGCPQPISLLEQAGTERGSSWYTESWFPRLIAFSPQSKGWALDTAPVKIPKAQHFSSTKLLYTSLSRARWSIFSSTSQLPNAIFNLKWQIYDNTPILISPHRIRSACSYPFIWQTFLIMVM